MSKLQRFRSVFSTLLFQQFNKNVLFVKIFNVLLKKFRASSISTYNVTRLKFSEPTTFMQEWFMIYARIEAHDSYKCNSFTRYRVNLDVEYNIWTERQRKATRRYLNVDRLDCVKEGDSEMSCSGGMLSGWSKTVGTPHLASKQAYRDHHWVLRSPK